MSILPKRIRAARSPKLVSGFIAAREFAIATGSAYLGEPFEARKYKGSDFTHFKSSKVTLTLLSSAQVTQKTCRFLLIFRDFYSQNTLFNLKSTAPRPSRRQL
jgi:hypothetical protein